MLKSILMIFCSYCYAMQSPTTTTPSVNCAPQAQSVADSCTVPQVINIGNDEENGDEIRNAITELKIERQAIEAKMRMYAPQANPWYIRAISTSIVCQRAQSTFSDFFRKDTQEELEEDSVMYALHKVVGERSFTYEKIEVLQRLSGPIAHALNL